MAEYFQDLESNDPARIDSAKQTLHMQLSQQRDSWLLNALYETYLKTHSVRYVDVLVNVMEPHHIHLFDKVLDSIQGNKYDEKVQALALLGHIVRHQTTWLFKITEHKLLKELMRLLKVETNILPLLSALLVLIILLPIIPSHIGQIFLEDIFQIFSRLAAWNCNNPEKLVEEQMVHMQIALYALFQRLYGMYPCNFLAYLRDQYKDKELSPIFSHTVKPMLSTVKIHPFLVTISKDTERTTERWKKMNSHDVILDCERFTLSILDHCLHESCLGAVPFRSRSGTTNSATFESPVPIQNFKNIPMGTFRTENYSPSSYFHSPQNVTEPALNLKHNLHIQSPNLINLAAMRIQSQEGTSPPEAAIEATPETTPIKDTRSLMSQRIAPSQVPRALTSFPGVISGHPTVTGKIRPLVTGIAPMVTAGSANTTPSHSQPSSPMRKEQQQYTSAFGVNKLHKMLQERSQAIDCDQPQTPPPFQPFSTTHQPRATHPHHRTTPTPTAATVSTGAAQPPGSPFRNIDPSVTHYPAGLRIESPVSSQEDQEVVAIVAESSSSGLDGSGSGGGSGGRGSRAHARLRQCDSVIHDVEGVRPMVTDDDLNTISAGAGADCDLSQGSPCSAGGLHMLDSAVITKYVERLRYHSQCASGNESYETGLDRASSPGSTSAPSLQIPKVRRANSCPEIKKLPTTSSIKDAVVQKPLDETDEDIGDDKNNLSNGVESDTIHKIKKVQMSTIETQTESFWPYEHLFLSIFPSSDQSDVIRPSPANSPLPIQPQHVTNAMIYANTNEVLDRYIDIAMNNTERDALKNVKSQLHLLYQQLLFERHHRESHACGNRKLLAESRSNRALEEHNSALRDQVQLHQRDIDKLKEQIEVYKKQQSCSITKENDDAYFYKSSCRNSQIEIKQLKEQNSQVVKQLQIERSNSSDLEKCWKIAENKLLHAQTEVKISQEQILAGQKCREELERVNRELLLCGELIERYKEYVAEIPLLKQGKAEIDRVTKAYLHEVRILQNQLDNRQVQLEACRLRIAELEHELIRRFDSCSEEKRSLNHAQEEYDEKIKAVQSKYHALMSINRSLEEKLLDMYQERELRNIKRGGGIHSPDTSSCHEANPTPSVCERATIGTGGGGGRGHSPHSLSPLSASLASSSDGGGSMSVGFLCGGTGSDGRGEVKNLQSIVDSVEAPTPTTASSTNPFGSPGTPDGDDIPLTLGDALAMISDMQLQQQQQQQPVSASSTQQQVASTSARATTQQQLQQSSRKPFKDCEF